MLRSRIDTLNLAIAVRVVVSYEAIRLWCSKFGPIYVDMLKKRPRGFGDTFFIGEVFVRIQGKYQYL